MSPTPRVFRRSPENGGNVRHSLPYSRRKHQDDGCHDDGCSDSGWSDVNDPPDIVGFVDSEDAGCSDEPDQEEKDTDASAVAAEEQVFELEMNNDIDLEQIEKD